MCQTSEQIELMKIEKEIERQRRERQRRRRYYEKTKAKKHVSNDASPSVASTTKVKPFRLSCYSPSPQRIRSKSACSTSVSTISSLKSNKSQRRKSLTIPVPFSFQRPIDYSPKRKAKHHRPIYKNVQSGPSSQQDCIIDLGNQQSQGNIPSERNEVEEAPESRVIEIAEPVPTADSEEETKEEEIADIAVQYQLQLKETFHEVTSSIEEFSRLVLLAFVAWLLHTLRRH